MHTNNLSSLNKMTRSKNKKFNRRKLCRNVVLASSLLFGSAAFANNIYVTTSADEFTDNSSCSLREAIYAAVLNTPLFGCSPGSATGMDEIIIQVPRVYVNNDMNLNFNNSDLTIRADGSPGTSGFSPAIIDGSSSDASTYIRYGENTRLIGLQFENFTATPLIIEGGNQNEGDYLRFINNEAFSVPIGASGVYVDGSSGASMEMSNCSFEGGDAVNGAIQLENGGFFYAQRCSFFQNHAIVGGGAVSVRTFGSFNTLASTYAENSALSGGAIYAAEETSLLIEASTIVDNMDSYYLLTGAGLDARGYTEIYHSVLANIGDSGSPENCNSLAPDLNQPAGALVDSFGSNFFEGDSQSYGGTENCNFLDRNAGDLIGTDAKLDIINVEGKYPYRYYYEPKSDSPIRNAGDFCGEDMLNNTVPSGSNCNLGSVY